MSHNASTGLDTESARAFVNDVTDAYIDGGGGTHWDGCHRAHPRCAALMGARNMALLLAEVERLQAAVVDRERLRDGIRHHRDEHHRLDSEPNHIDRELDRGGADLTLWALLDDRTETT